MPGPRAWGDQRLGAWDSPRFRDGIFHNDEATYVLDGSQWTPMALEWAAKRWRAQPPHDVPVVAPVLGAAGELAVTWLGHASMLVELDGQWVLMDPIFSDRPSPVASIGPRRTHPSPLDVAALPPLTAVVISHDHYDHLDLPTIVGLIRTQEAPFVVPLGIGAHLRRWGVPEERIIERDWGGDIRLGSLTITCTAARHFSGRWLTRNRTLWSSWVLAADDGARVFFGGDTGYTPAFTELGRTHGSFDLTMVPIGAYDRRWPDIHLDPEQAVQTHLDVAGGVMLPMHWLTWDLAFHPWDEPMERTLAAAERHDVAVATPRPGERFEMGSVPTNPWWRSDYRPL